MCWRTKPITRMDAPPRALSLSTESRSVRLIGFAHAWISQRTAAQAVLARTIDFTLLQAICRRNMSLAMVRKSCQVGQSAIQSSGGPSLSCAGQRATECRLSPLSRMSFQRGHSGPLKCNRDGVHPANTRPSAILLDTGMRPFGTSVSLVRMIAD